MSDGRSDGRSDETNISRRCPARHRDPIHIHSKLPSIEDELEGEEEDVDYCEGWKPESEEDKAMAVEDCGGRRRVGRQRR